MLNNKFKRKKEKKKEKKFQKIVKGPNIITSQKKAAKTGYLFRFSNDITSCTKMISRHLNNL